MSSDVNYILELTGSEWENLLNDRALDFQVRNYEGDGAQNGCQVSNEVGAPQNETSLPVQSTYGNLYDEFGILNVSPYPPADIFDGQDQESTPQQQQSFNEQPPMSTQPPVVVRVVRRRRPKPSEDESGQITVSDPLGQMVQHSSAGIPVTGSQQSNTFQGPRAVSEISVPLYAVPQSTAVVIPQQQQTFTAAKTGGVVDVPALTDMEGDYGFSVTIEEKERTTKSPMWLMSSVTNKLYTNINKAVPFEIQLRKKVPSDKSFYIRAVAVFSSAQFLRTNVTRCPNHASTADMTNHGFPYPTHVVRADHPEAKYEESLTGRLSVVVPLDKLVDGSDFTPILLRFMCLGSCVGGINRRPIAIILTLENGLGQVFGRKVIDVRVCACPTRDIRTDELALSNKGGKRRGSSHQEKTLPPPRKKPKVEPKVEPQDDDNKLFTIVVRGRKLYDFLTLVKESYLKTHPECADRYHDPRSFDFLN